MVYIQYLTFFFLNQRDHCVPQSNKTSEFRDKQVNSNIQVFRKKMCYMGANENETFSSYYIQENYLNIGLEWLKLVSGTPLKKYSTILSIILVIPKAELKCYMYLNYVTN